VVLIYFKQNKLTKNDLE